VQKTKKNNRALHSGRCLQVQLNEIGVGKFQLWFSTWKYIHHHSIIGLVVSEWI